MKFFVIGDEDTVLGFSMAGVRGEVVETPEQARDALKRAMNMEDLGILMIPERIAATIRSDVEQHQFKTSFPLIITVPDRTGPMEGRRSIRDLVREAVGVQL